MHLENYDKAEKEKADFVGDGFIECHANFLDFKEGNTYWLEYIGDDKYNVRSDNLLGKTYHITPCQLYTVFKKLTWLEKQGEQKPAQNKSEYIYINQNIIDYINKRKWRFENKMPHIGDVWHIIEITSYTGVNGGQPVVEVENKDGEWMRLPLDIVDIRK